MERLNQAVEEFTTPNPITATEDTTTEELQRIMREHEIRHILITKNGEVVGVVSDRDLRVLAGLNIRERINVHAKDIMAKDPVSVDSEMSLDQVAFQMSTLKIGSVVVNEGNKLLGIFTVTDALNALVEITRSERH